MPILAGVLLAGVDRWRRLGVLPSVEEKIAPTVDARFVADMEGITRSLFAGWYTIASGNLLPAASGHFVMLRSVLPGPTSLSHSLASVTGHAALLVGHTMLKLDRRGEAFAQFALAEFLAREAGDEILRAVVLATRAAMYSPVALGHREGDSAHALAHLDEAATAAGHQIQTPSRLRVTVLARRAEERAAAGDATGVVRDLEAAHESLAIPSEGIYFGPRNEVELGALRGACELLLGQHRQAVTTLHATAERMDPSLVAWRAAVLADQGAALARMGQVDEACGRLSAALDLARQAAAADHLHRIRGVRERDLVRWGDAAPVRQLDEQLAL